MPAARFASVTKELHEALAAAAWIQWQALGGQAAAHRSPASIVDPEALVLVSLWLRRDELRLWDFLHGLAGSGTRLLSVQRLKRLLVGFPETVRAEADLFAGVAARAGRDSRWRGFSAVRTIPTARSGKWSSPLSRLAAPGTLVLRLRTAFGVDVRTDVLAYLIGRREAWCTVREVSDALGYAGNSVRAACESLSDARVLDRHAGRPARFAAPARWRALLELGESPPWQPWSEVYPFVVRALVWLRGEGARPMSDSLASSLARQLVREHGAVLGMLQAGIPDHRDHLAEAYLPLFERSLGALGAWLRERA